MVATLPPPVDDGDGDAAVGGRLVIVDETGTARGAGTAGEGRPAGAPRVPGLVLLRRLGAGGHGEVWLAADIVAGDQVAVKVRRGPPGAGDDPRLSREIALLRRIDDPHVVRLRRVVDLPTGGRALVMDLAAGGSLAELVAERGPLAAAEVCTTVVPVARTLAALHRRGIVHGDLSPANVLFSGTGRPMIADLGCAVVLGARPDAAWGADGYADPARSGPAAPPDDVYALGALIRFSLTGDPAGGDGSGGPGDGGRGDGGRGGPHVDGLLALADLCTSPGPADRPGPAALAEMIHSTTPSSPVRLVRRGRGGGGAGGGAGGAAARGWTRPASPPAPTVATALPVTSVDLALAPPAASGDPFPAAAGGAFPAAGGDAFPAARDDPFPAASATAVTRRRTVPASRRAAPPAAAGRGRRPAGTRRGRRAARSASRPGRRGWAWGALTLVAGAVLAGLVAVRVLPGRGPAEAGGHTPSSGQGSSPGRGDGPGPGDGPGQSSPRPAATVPEPLPGAIVRLARQRAAAFTTVSERALAAVDEPGSPALSADTALVARLGQLGVRLDGLSFEVRRLRPVPGAAGLAVVEATVTTSAHRQVATRDGAVRAEVPASTRTVVLTLVPSADGQRWLVRSARGREPP